MSLFYKSFDNFEKTLAKLKNDYYETIYGIYKNIYKEDEQEKCFKIITKEVTDFTKEFIDKMHNTYNKVARYHFSCIELMDESVEKTKLMSELTRNMEIYDNFMENLNYEEIVSKIQKDFLSEESKKINDEISIESLLENLKLDYKDYLFTEEEKKDIKIKYLPDQLETFEEYVDVFKLCYEIIGSKEIDKKLKQKYICLYQTTQFFITKNTEKICPNKKCKNEEFCDKCLELLNNYNIDNLK